MPLQKSTRTLIILVIIAAALVAMRLLDASLLPSLSDIFGVEIFKTLNTPWFTIGGEHTKPQNGLEITPVLLIQAMIFLIGLTLASRLGRRFFQTRLLSRTSLDPGQQYSFARIAGYILFLIGLMVGLQTMGLDLSSLTFLGGAIGIGLGFGLQAVVNNFVSGLILLVERPIKVGDRVEVGGVTGDVMKIGARSTWVRGNDNSVIIVPNLEFITGRVLNWTAIESIVRFKVSVGVSYDADPEKVRLVLTGIARSHPDVLQDPPPDAILTGLADSSMKFDLRFWTSRQAHTPPRIMSDLYFSIVRSFREQGIEIPYPKTDIHVRSVPAPSAGAPTS